MPRKPRVFVEGGVYHVYNRLVRGERLFEDMDIAGSFLALLRRVRDRDGLTIFGWCVMPNHYHLAVRAGPVPLSRSVGHIQSLFGREYNRSRKSSGPRWQARYQAKLVDDSRYLRQLVLYIHLNPATAGVVNDPSDYPFSGHRELLGTTLAPLASVEDVLGMFGSSLVEARQGYVDALLASTRVDWIAEGPGRLPWWHREPDRPIQPPTPFAWIDERGVSTGRKRPRLSAEAFLVEVCELLHVPIGSLASSTRAPRTMRARYLAAGLAVERWGVPPKALAERLGRWPEVVSRWASRAGRLRLDREDFRRDFEHLDAQLSNALRTRDEARRESPAHEFEEFTFVGESTDARAGRQR